MLSIVTIGAALSFGVAQAVAADDVTEDQILRALAPAKKPLTRGLSVGPPGRSGRRPPRKGASSRRSAAAPRVRSRSASARKSPPSPRTSRISIWKSPSTTTRPISAPSRCPRCRRSGKALTNPDLKGSTFIVAGHTDAAGGDGYNQDLSERRADSIKRYLTDKYGIAGADLVTVGYGKSKLKDPASRWRKRTAACRSSTWRTRPPRPGNRPKRIVAPCSVFQLEPPFRSRSGTEALCLFDAIFPARAGIHCRWKTL